MNIFFRKIAPLFLVLCLIMSVVLLASCTSDSGSEQSEDSSKPDAEKSAPLVYIALGDSVAAGFGSPQENSYPSVFFGKLKDGGYANEYKNMAVSGYTTTNLLQLLNDMSDDNLKLFKNAVVVTVNIGGNNILMPFFEHLPSMEELTASIAEFTEFFAESKETISKAVEFAGEAQGFLDNFSVADILKLNAFMKEASATMADVSAVFNQMNELKILKIVSLMSGKFPPELETALQKGVEIFAGEFVQIIAWLKENAPDATIIVNTVYNPIPPQISGLSLEISNTAKSYIQSINNIIIENIESGEYMVANIFDRFESEPNITDLTNFDLDLSTLTLVLDIIHPNIEGHKVIADLNDSAFLTYRNYGRYSGVQ